MGVLVISQFCVRDGEANEARLAGFRGEFPAKPQGTDVRRILIAHAMRQESVVRNGHKIAGGFAAGTADGESIFADRSPRSEEHTSELQSLTNLVCRLLLEKKKIKYILKVLTIITTII